MADSLTHIATFVLAQKDARAMQILIGAISAHPITVLSPDKAFEYGLPSCDAKTVQDDLSDRARALGIIVDICVQPLQGRRKNLLICDMDSTLIGQECIDELADFAGVKPRVSAITERAMRGELDFDSALKERVGLLKDLPLSALQTCFDERIHLNAGAKTLARTMSAHGAKTVIVSGGFTFFTTRIAALAGFDHHQANILLEQGDKLSGHVGLPILGRAAKRDALNAYSKDLGGPSAAIAIGDGANDLAMITAAGLGIAYYAKPAVADAAHCAIKHTDLTTALYYQGYKDADFTI